MASALCTFPALVTVSRLHLVHLVEEPLALSDDSVTKLAQLTTHNEHNEDDDEHEGHESSYHGTCHWTHG